MAHRKERHCFRVGGIRANESRDARYSNLSWETAQQDRYATIQAGLYQQVVIEHQLERKRSAGRPPADQH
jgi:hypothetical protein